MRKSLIAAAFVGAFSLPLVASADDAAAPAEAPAAAPTPDNVVTANVGLFSNYVVRGLTQTNGRPAIQGGLDYSHSSGVYAGLWGSNISWLRDNGSYQSGGSLELDLYGGYKGSIGDTGIGYDVGTIYYYYPGEETLNQTTLVRAPRGDTMEAYVGLNWKWFTLKYSYSLLNQFLGFPNSRGTDYIDFSVAVPIADTGLTVGAHYGDQEFKGATSDGTSNDRFSYADWRVSLAYDLGKATTVLTGTEVGVVYTDTAHANSVGYGALAGYPRNIGESFTTVYIKRTF